MKFLQSELDEMEKKKEKILMMSLARRQAQEEQKARKEMEAARRKEAEKFKEDEKLRKKEEERARRAVILDQYKLKKAIEEAEREVCTIFEKRVFPSFTNPAHYSCKNTATNKIVNAALMSC